ncbi:hypothetical protein AVEN_106880-1 [Araneus ventricosus]|uniref:DDE-1 domain-containing protein n=1 Tax=Araneus ventricosus TaxID=182803 RepID=A0A4Y2TRZ7_ARAVE|nr:hypothetical protein AVEN_138266-1 [Araneus ventricosus]GBO00440.1 hypothetical protein AVEN_211024-1 [Araneus ventricosus]GBO03305.1 hypothetical protein AVEN_218878-1 [Araneus ventricosus]GBO03308.1 hypothetical protein AVEN_106880-1 [Araneus ventricosus]
MNIFFKRNLVFYQERANNQSTRCVSVDAALSETKTHKQPIGLPLCMGMREKKKKKKEHLFSRSVGSVPAELLDIAAHSPSKLKLERVAFSLRIFCTANGFRMADWASVSTLLINKSWKNFLPNFVDSEVEENVQTEEIQLASLINQLQNTSPMSEADDSLARNEILTDNEIIGTVIPEEEYDDDVIPVNPVKFLILSLWWHSTLHYSGLKSKILKHTKICSSDV